MKIRMIFAGLLLGAAVTLQAQVSIGGSVDMSIVPFQFVQGDERDITDGYGNVIGSDRYSNTMGAGMGGILQNNGPRIRLDARAVNEEHRIGMRLRLEALAGASGNPVIRGENFLQAWWSPLEWLRIDAGRFDDDRLRGRIGDDEMGMFTNMMFGPDQIFSRFRVRNGLMLSATPIEGLLLATALRELVNFETATTTPGDVNIVNNRHVNGNAWRNMTFAAGYTIPDIGLIRAQFIGDVPPAGTPGITRNNNLEFAFALTAIDGLLLDLGGTVHLYDADYISPDFGFSLGARFRADALEFIGRVDTQISGNDEPFELNAHIWPSFQMDSARVIFNFGVNFVEGIGEDNADVTLGAGLSLQRNFIGNTRVRGGIAFAFPTDSRPMVFSIPLFLEYSF